jgi:hypothetical protein
VAIKTLSIAISEMAMVFQRINKMQNIETASPSAKPNAAATMQGRSGALGITTRFGVRGLNGRVIPPESVKPTLHSVMSVTKSCFLL